MRVSIFVAALLASSAFASVSLATPPGNQGGGNGGCGVGQQTNGCGGQGGAGGAGGDAQAVGVGIGVGVGIAGAEANAGAVAINGPNTALGGQGGSVIAPVTTTVAPRIDTSVDTRIDNRDTNVVGVDSRNTNLNGQGQFIAGSGNSSSSSGSSSSSDQTQAQTLTDASTHTVTSANTATTGASTSGATSSSAGQTASYVDNSVYEAQKRNPVASAYAAPLSIGGGVCAYTPVSASGQFVTFGLSGSAAKIDQGCETRATADMFARMGMGYEACLIMVSQGPALRAGLTTESCVRPAPVAYVVTPPAEPKPPVTMLPIPDPVLPKHDGERGR